MTKYKYIGAESFVFHDKGVKQNDIVEMIEFDKYLDRTDFIEMPEELEKIEAKPFKKFKGGEQ